jgi:hypothetical protein
MAILMKAPFKAILVSALATFSVFTSITYISCNRDKCKSVVCGHGGVCNSGACVCPSGYEGSNCETETREKFLGTWRVFEKGTRTPANQYAITIEKSSPQLTDVVITNFYNYFHTSIKASVIGDTLFIPNQQYEGKLTFGVGYIYSNVTYGQFGLIAMRYEVVDTATNIPNDFGYYAQDLSDPSAWNK